MQYIYIDMWIYFCLSICIICCLFWFYSRYIGMQGIKKVIWTFHGSVLVEEVSKMAVLNGFYDYS